MAWFYLQVLETQETRFFKFKCIFLLKFETQVFCTGNSFVTLQVILCVMLGCFTKKEYTAVAEQNVTTPYCEILFIFFRSLYNSQFDYTDNTVHFHHFCYQLPSQTNNTLFVSATASSLRILKFVRWEYFVAIEEWMKLIIILLSLIFFRAIDSILKMTLCFCERWVLRSPIVWHLNPQLLHWHLPSRSAVAVGCWESIGLRNQNLVVKHEEQWQHWNFFLLVSTSELGALDKEHWIKEDSGVNLQQWAPG